MHVAARRERLEHGELLGREPGRPEQRQPLGQVDDVFLVTTALQRLIANAGRHVLLDHWRGDRAELSDLNIERIVAAAAFFLPLAMRRKLKGVGRR